MYNLLKYSQDYSMKSGSLWFYSKDESTNFNADIANYDNFESFKHKAKLLENKIADGANGILRNAAIAVLLKYLSNFWRSLEMPLINFKVKLKLKWTKYCVLCAACADNDNANPDNIIFTIKDTKNICPYCNFISKKQSKTINTS